MLLDKANKDLNEADVAERGASTMFNEQQRYELNLQRLQTVQWKR
jgi:hypothetical protein